ncbi:aspartate aminotransferase family protein [Candidatus Contubernalis alkaliaceticus]|uniref:aspartate aminotransferase family protein n=1 Tax=Candidatus Contubernalis alkaliaceticus TaxID=338645 RepID=UPI001F4BEB38|nr:aspartate aminotransferase family protein [Candidatus Contubernalis alkalaceticus]UNC91488.1 aspartate aminotransferase family protein [Candidatus Contubernalis alkalaceticus]
MENIKELEKKYIINTYGRDPEVTPLFVKGQGSNLWDEQGNSYLDLVSGLAVNILGHCPKVVVDALQEQSKKLFHCSNLFYTEPQVQLAQLLVENSSLDQVFFCNSGAEANEAAIKLARKYAKLFVDEDRFEIITALKSFHGRTMATITATGQPKFHQGFEPMVPGFKYAPFNDLEAFASLVGDQTCAILVEPVQGEGGVHVGTVKFIQGLRNLCDEKKLLLIFDEVQCGIGRTGKFLASEHYGVQPDITTLAKGLGGGVPIGAMMAVQEVARGFNPGDHATTFGGNPLACAAAIAVLKTILENDFLVYVKRNSEYFVQELEQLKKKLPSLIKEIRASGMMVAVEIEGDSRGREVMKECLKKGLVINCIGGNVLRFLPPLNVTASELRFALDVLEGVLKKLK